MNYMVSNLYYGNGVKVGKRRKVRRAKKFFRGSYDSYSLKVRKKRDFVKGIGIWISGIMLLGRFLKRNVKDGKDVVGDIYKNVKRVKGDDVRIVVGPVFVIVFLLVFSGVLGLVQLASSNHFATKGYELRKLESDRQRLLDEYEVSSLKLSKARSLSEIIHSEQVARMRIMHDVVFLRGNNVVAKVD